MNRNWGSQTRGQAFKKYRQQFANTTEKIGNYFLLNVLVWLHVPDKLRPSGAMGCLVESHRQAQVVMEA